MNMQKPIQISLKEINPPIIHSHKFEPTAIKYILNELNFTCYEKINAYVKEFKSEFTVSNGSITMSIPLDVMMMYHENKKKEKFTIYCNNELILSTKDAELFISEAFNLTEHEN